jgi:hypothetical protein
MPRIVRHLVAALLVVCAAPVARAQTDVGHPPELPRATPRLVAPFASGQTPQPQPSWYGWQVWAADAAVLAITYACVSKTDGECLWTLPGYLLAGPIIHSVHNRPARGLGSVALRIGAPLLGAYVGAETTDCSHTDDNFCGAAGILGGLAFGVVAAIFIDGIMSFESSTPSPRPAPARSVTPTVSVAGGNTVFGVVGRF